MRKAKIYQPARTATQGGNAKKSWILELPSKYKRYRESLMNWVGSKDTEQQLALTLKFDSAEEAQSFCHAKGIFYDIEYPKTHIIRPKSYADNFIE